MKSLADGEEKSLQFAYARIVQRHLLQTRLRLDAVTSQDGTVFAMFKRARSLDGQKWQHNFLVEQLANMTSYSIALVSGAFMTYKVSAHEQAAMAVRFAEV